MVFAFDRELELRVQQPVTFHVAGGAQNAGYGDVFACRERGFSFALMCFRNFITFTLGKFQRGRERDWPLLSEQNRLLNLPVSWVKLKGL